MDYRFSLPTFILLSLQSAPAHAQSHQYDLSYLAEHQGLITRNRTLTPLPGEKALRFSAAEADGVAWLKGIEFSNGVIEVDIRGKKGMQQSFAGIAFHGSSADRLEAVYFRPFNFRSGDPEHHEHMVQYVSHPEFPWDRLRREQAGIFEKGIFNPPDSDTWFHAKIVVRYPKIEVYVNHSPTPSLAVTELGKRKKGMIGLWTGNHSAGDFANLMVTYE
jgi:hypothetical protein